MCCICPTKSGDCCVSSWENDVHDLDDVEVDDVDVVDDDGDGDGDYMMI